MLIRQKMCDSDRDVIIFSSEGKLLQNSFCEIFQRYIRQQIRYKRGEGKSRGGWGQVEFTVLLSWENDFYCTH